MFLKKVAATIAVFAALAVGSLVAPTVAHATAYCGIYWGSTDKAGPAAGYGVRYVPAVTEQANGDSLALRGDASLEIVVRTSACDLATGAPTYTATDPE